MLKLKTINLKEIRRCTLEKASSLCGKMPLVTMLQVISYYQGQRDDIASN